MTDRPMRFAYADPPYIGQARPHYGREAAAHGRTAREVNHPLLIQHLIDEYPDGWALSLSTPTAYLVMGMVEACGLSFHRGDVRLMAWVKPFAVYKPNVNPAYAWEPIIVRGGARHDA